MADRAQVLLWSHQAFNRLPMHVRSLDVGGMRSTGEVISAGDVEEFCLLTEYATGEMYAKDLERIRDTSPRRLVSSPIISSKAACAGDSVEVGTAAAAATESSRIIEFTPSVASRVASMDCLMLSTSSSSSSWMRSCDNRCSEASRYRRSFSFRPLEQAPPAY